MCYFDKREIKLLSSMTAEDLLGTAIHEVIHAQCPYLTEAEVVMLEAVVMRTIVLVNEHNAG